MEEFAATAETFAGRVHIEWDSDGLVTPLGQLPFFVECLKQAGLFAGWVADCPLTFSSPNAPSKHDLPPSSLFCRKGGEAASGRSRSFPRSLLQQIAKGHRLNRSVAALIRINQDSAPIPYLLQAIGRQSMNDVEIDRAVPGPGPRLYAEWRAGIGVITDRFEWASIEPHFCGGIALPGLHSREIKAVTAQRF